MLLQLHFKIKDKIGESLKIFADTSFWSIEDTILLYYPSLYIFFIYLYLINTLNTVVLSMYV